MSQCYCDGCQTIDYCHSSKIDYLMEENARLREALEQILKKGPASPGDKKHEIAAKALQN